jgi:hypothetical protein
MKQQLINNDERKIILNYNPKNINPKIFAKLKLDIKITTISSTS